MSAENQNTGSSTDSEPKVIQSGIENNHVAGCGTPPEIDPNDVDYLSYFENIYGEQLVFIYKAELGEAWYFNGDAGWERPRVLTDEEISQVDADTDPITIKTLGMGNIGKAIRGMAKMFGFDEDEIDEMEDMAESHPEKAGIQADEEDIWLKSCLLAIQHQIDA